MKRKIPVLLILFFIIPVISAFADETLYSYSAAPGFYNHDLKLSLTPQQGYSIYYSFNESRDGTKVEYRFPLLLSAMPGEERSYVLNLYIYRDTALVQSEKVEYTIDKSVPLEPVPDYTPGVYDSNLEISFPNKQEQIFYSVNSDSDASFSIWKNEAIELEQASVTRQYIVKSYAMDNSGNRSAVSVNRYTILASEPALDAIDIPSPAEGTFLNSQLLYVNTRGFKWVRYSFNDVDPVSRGTVYLEPVMIKVPGDYSLNVAAMVASSGKILNKRIDFTIIGTGKAVLSRESGVFTDKIEVLPRETSYNYTFEEREVKSWDPVLPEKMELLPVPGVLKYTTVRLSKPGETGEYRYFFALDKRIPAAPLISIDSAVPISSDTRIRITGVPGADIYYSLDGSTPDRYSAFYKRPFSISIPPGRETGSMIIKAVAYFSDKSTSVVSSRLISYDRKIPDPPEISKYFESKDTVRFRIKKSITDKIIYTVSYNGEEPENPDIDSFTGKEDMILRVPSGTDVSVKIKVSLIDRAGNISVPVTQTIMDSDTVPPEAPVVSVDAGIVSINGSNNKVYYRIQDAYNADRTIYELYEDKIILNSDPSGLTEAGIYSYAVDSAGNKSNTSVYYYKSDKRTPAVPEITGVVDGGKYNKPVILKVNRTDDINFFYRISSSDLQNVAENNFIPLDGNEIFFDIKENRETNYKIEYYSKYDDSNPTEINSMEFLIDGIPPEPPALKNISDGEVFNHDCILDIEAKENEKVLLLINNNLFDSDLTIKSFIENGVYVGNSYKVSTPDDHENKYSVSLMSVDGAGNYSKPSGIINFRIDKTRPDPPMIDYSFSNETGEYMVNMYTEEEDAVVSYLINNNSLTDTDYSSENWRTYSEPVIIKKNNNESIFLTARTTDEGGNISENAAYLKIDINDTDSVNPDISVSCINGTKYIVSFPTIPGSTIYLKNNESDYYKYTGPLTIDLRDSSYTDIFYYAQTIAGGKGSVNVYRINKLLRSDRIITGIDNNSVYNSTRTVKKANNDMTVRYEVSVNSTSPGEVTIFSPELKDKITFDAAEGESLNVALKVREFSGTSNEYESSEQNYSFIIDKSSPGNPAIFGITNNDYYQNDQSFELTSEENSTIYYNLIINNMDVNNGKSIRYTSPVFISTEDGSYSRIQIAAYSEDMAGNRSQKSSWEFYIDKANIYVDNKSGNDNNDGTRTRPLRTLLKAVQTANSNERNRIYIASGDYFINKTIEIQKDLTLYGGYETDTWKSSENKTIINAVKTNFSGNSLVEVKQNASLEIYDLSFSNINLTGSMFNVRNGSLRIESGTLYHANSTNKVSIETVESDVLIKDSALVFGPVKKTELFVFNNSNVNLENIKITGTGESEDLTVFNLKNSNVKITDSVIDPGISDNTKIFNSLDSRIIFTGNNLESGLSRIKTVIFNLENTEINIKESMFSTDARPRILNCFNLKKSKADITDSNFLLDSSSGTSFARLNNTDFSLSRSTFELKKTKEFIYLVTSIKSNLELTANKISVGMTDSFKLVETSEGGRISVEENNIDISENIAVSRPFIFESPAGILFSGNILKGSIHNNSGALIYLKSLSDQIIIDSNRFPQWTPLVEYNGNYIIDSDALNSYNGFIQKPSGNK